MIKVILIDDEVAGRVLLKQYLQAYPEFEIIAEAENGIQAVELINELKPDLLFLDIQMPGLTGFEVVTKINVIPQIIFSTAYDEYALKAFEVHAVDYLLKPYSKDRFARAIEGLHSSHSAQTGLGALAENLIEKKQAFPKRILVSNNKKFQAIKTEEIIWIAAYGDYSKIHTAESRFISGKGISLLEQKLDPSIFMRVHRSSIVNVNEILMAEKYGKEFLLKLSNGDQVMVSRANVKKIRGLIL